MISSLNPLSATSISHVVNRILGSGKITREDEYVFQVAMVAEAPLNAQELSQVSDIYNRLQMGLLKVVD